MNRFAVWDVSRSMHIPIWILLTLATPQLEETVRQQEQEIRQLETEIQQLASRNRELEAELQRPICSAEIRSANDVGGARVPISEEVLVQLSFYSTVSRPESSCLPAEVRVAASYLGPDGNLLCSGVIRDVATQREATAIINLHIRPWNTAEFIRWANEPPETNSGTHMLFCISPDGQREVAPTTLVGATSVRLRTTLLPPGGGLSTESFVIEVVD